MKENYLQNITEILNDNSAIFEIATIMAYEEFKTYFSNTHHIYCLKTGKNSIENVLHIRLNTGVDEDSTYPNLIIDFFIGYSNSNFYFLK